MQREQTRYSRLAHITKMINTKLELRELLEHVVTAISEEIVQCDSVGIYLPEENGDFRGFVGKPKYINGMTLDMHVVDMEYDRLAKEVVETKKSIYIPDTSVDNRPDPRAVAGFQIKSLLGLPIMYEEELYGLVFLFDYGIPMNLTQEEIQSVEAYVNMAGVAIRNAKNMNRKEDLLNEKQLLLDFTRELSMCATMPEVLDKCFSYVGTVLNNSNVGVHLLDPSVEEKIKPANLSKNSDWTEEEWLETHEKAKMDASSDPVFLEVVRTKKPLLIPNVHEDDRPNHEICQNFGIKGMFMIPLVSMGKVLGALAIVELEAERLYFREADIQLAQSIADATAATLSNLIYMEKQEMLIETRTSELTLKNLELERVVGELGNLSREKELILNSAGEGIFGLDLHGHITFCNPASESMLGYMPGELIGKRVTAIFGHYEKTLSDASYSTQNEQFIKKDQSNLAVEYVISSINEGDKRIGEVVTFKDITERQKLEEEIKHLAYYDSLTDLPNRVLLNDQLKKWLSEAEESGKKLALMYLDLDRFKMINDSLGHSYGDMLLKETATRLRTNIPDCALVSRQGGDEFMIILPEMAAKKDIYPILKQVIESFTAPFSLKENEIYIKASIGISVYPEDGETAEELIKNADSAMYKSKEMSGSYFHFFKSEMNNRNLESIYIENSLYKALDLDEMAIYYQPQIDGRTQTITGAEALLRWNHSKLGMISPVDFIPLAEETGLIIPIGKWVLENACKQLKHWKNEGYVQLTMSVNLSGRQFEEEDLVPMIKEILEDLKLDPSCLHIELTENQIVKNTKVAIEKMKQLKELGVKISIDDFGTGYSSLGYLKDFPLDTLKIDRSFIMDVTENAADAAITNTIITLAKNLNLNVVAEGVETAEQLAFLLSKDCHIMQGFYFSRPIEAAALEEKYLMKNKK